MNLTFLNSFAQSKMIINESFSGYTVYNCCTTFIDSNSKLPPIIQLNVDKFFEKILGSMSINCKFSHGQIVDLKKYFSVYPMTYTRGWIVPKYDLHFRLQDTSVGIVNYYLIITLDEYGQILTSNWPRSGYADKNKFISRNDIEKYILITAKKRGFDIVNYRIDFHFNRKLDKLCWTFEFPKFNEYGAKLYDYWEVDWLELGILSESTLCCD